jgi:hypothetical protein
MRWVEWGEWGGFKGIVGITCYPITTTIPISYSGFE